MAGGLDHEQVEALLKKNQALVARQRERVTELEAQNVDTLQEICTSLTVPASAFGMSYARGYFGERASILGIPIDACLGLVMKIVGACFGLSVSKGGQRVGKFFHDIANGAFASWTAALGAEFGAKKRLETPMPAPAPQPNVGAAHSAQATPTRAPAPVTFEELAAITAARQETPMVATPAPQPSVGAVGSAQTTPKRAPPLMTFEELAAIAEGAMLRTPLAPPQRAPVHVQSSVQPVPTKQPAAKAAAAPATTQSSISQQSPLNAQQTPNGRAATAPTSPSTPQKPYRFTRKWAVDPEAEMRALLQSVGAPADPNTVTHLLSHAYPGEEFKAILRRSRSPA